MEMDSTCISELVKGWPGKWPRGEGGEGETQKRKCWEEGSWRASRASQGSELYPRNDSFPQLELEVVIPCSYSRSERAEGISNPKVISTPLPVNQHA